MGWTLFDNGLRSYDDIKMEMGKPISLIWYRDFGVEKKKFPRKCFPLIINNRENGKKNQLKKLIKKKKVLIKSKKFISTQQWEEKKTQGKTNYGTLCPRVHKHKHHSICLIAFHLLAFDLILLFTIFLKN